MATTPTYGWPRPTLTDPADIEVVGQALDQIDEAVTARVSANYTNVKHDVRADASNVSLSPAWSFPVTNPLAVPQLLRVDVGGLAYGTTASADLCYYRPRVVGAGVTIVADPEGRLDFPDGDSGTIYLQITNWCVVRVPASATVTVELTGRHTGSTTGQWYVQFASLLATWLGATT